MVEKKTNTKYKALVSTRVEPPPYGARSGFVPRTIHDFGDGGSFPEIHVAQFPLGMGKPKTKKSNALAVHLDADGKVKYDALGECPLMVLVLNFSVRF